MKFRQIANPTGAVLVVSALSACTSDTTPASLAKPLLESFIEGVVLRSGEPPNPGCNIFSDQQTGPELAVSTGTDGAFRIQVMPGHVLLRLKCQDEEISEMIIFIKSGETLSIGSPWEPWD